jgi:hypothetical protein
MVKVPAEWLTQRVDDAPTSYHRKVGPVAALRVRMAWQKLKSRAGEGDELWAFSSPPNSWNRQARYTGYALVRDGRIVESAVVTDD